jgi:uncharacterized protein YkwD
VGRCLLLRLVFSGSGALALVAAAAALIAAPVSASQRTVNAAEMVRLVNHARVAHGLAPLRVDAALSRAALAHSRDMVSRHYFSHTSPGGASQAARARRAGYSTSGCLSWVVAEAIGWSGRFVGTPRAVFDSWMRSAYHRAVILGRRWRDVGIGCASGTFQGVSGSWMYTVDVGRRSR